MTHKKTNDGRNKVKPMAEQWDKVARWAGIGNNRESGSAIRSGDGMVEEMTVQGSEEKDGTGEGVQAGGAETTDAGGEGFGDPAASSSVAATTELEQVRGERDQLMDRLARLQAEFENTRRREGKERADLRDYAVQHAVEPFLAVMDNFQLALKADGTLEQLRAGVELILKQMEEALKGLQVQAVESVGTQFDPRIHEALGSIETTEFPDHQVMEEIRRGYRIREKLLRPALVRIASNHAVVSE
jgi:molecular chaperone GrpE